MEQLTPMMNQYMQIKDLYADCILFFRLGDFYEMFFNDAIIASKELEITLTGKDCGQKERAPMCGVPFHSADSYIAKLVSKGYKVAICEQVEDPATAKGIVERDVIRIVTPGTITDVNTLDESANNYIAVLYKTLTQTALSFADITTGEMYCTSISSDYCSVMNELARYKPAEIVCNSLAQTAYGSELKQRNFAYVQTAGDEFFDASNSQKHLLDCFNAASLDELKLESGSACAVCVGAMVLYLENTQKSSISHIKKLNVYKTEEYMGLDMVARQNLELTETIRSKTKKGSLLWVLDKTSTSMGARMLRRWLEKPLLDAEKINMRLKAVDEFYSDLMLREDISQILKGVYDMERIISRVAMGSASPRDLTALKMSASRLPLLKDKLSLCKSSMIKSMYDSFDTLDDIKELLEQSIEDEPPVNLKDGGVIKKGYNDELDQLRLASSDGKSWLAKIESQEREKTQIKNLKIGYNKVFGYYIEVTNSYKNLVPEGYIRKQTLSNCERYITEELKNIETMVLGAQEKSVILEGALFADIKSRVNAQLERIKAMADIVAITDTLVSFAHVAIKNNYVMPVVDNSSSLSLKDARHPVVEKNLTNGLFVPNDTVLDTDNNRLAIITGPNMAGKSTYMRQVALIAVMAQIGSFVPASQAHIGVVDKIFTRIGASDDLAMGQSTFMVEMNEMASILENATANSLIILDEIGRGTSTYDGLSIAWSVAEYICNKNIIGAKTLFATHYHELTALEGLMDGVKNYSVAVKKRGDDIIFLRKIVSGGTDDSYGVEVAALAGLPDAVIRRAKELLYEIEHQQLPTDSTNASKPVSFDDSEDNKVYASVIDEIKNLDASTLTPIEAMNKLYELSVKLKDAESDDMGFLKLN